MPFGLKTELACFRRLMNGVFRHEFFQILLCYIDDILLYGKFIAKGLERLQVVFRKLSEYGLELERKKCSFFLPEVL